MNFMYKALLKKHSNSRIVLVGESAGGNLVLVVTLMAKAAGIMMPSCVCSFSPITNIAEAFPSRISNCDVDIVIPSNINEMLLQSYVQKGDPYNPFVSPVFGNFSGFPPLKIFVDKSEVL